MVGALHVMVTVLLFTLIVTEPGAPGSVCADATRGDIPTSARVQTAADISPRIGGSSPPGDGVKAAIEPTVPALYACR